MATRKKATKRKPARLHPDDRDDLMSSFSEAVSATVGLLRDEIEGRLDRVEREQTRLLEDLRMIAKDGRVRMERLERYVGAPTPDDIAQLKRLQEADERVTHGAGWPDEEGAPAPARKPALGRMRTVSAADEAGIRPAMPALQEIADVAFGTAEELSEIADGLHQQLDRLAGAEPPDEAMKDSPSGGGVVGDLRHAIERIRHQVGRVREALPRIASL